MTTQAQNPVLRRGMQGESVLRAQKRICAHFSYLIETDFADGYFGPETEQQVRFFQKSEKLMIDGVVGKDTWIALLSDKGSSTQCPVGRTASTLDRREEKSASAAGKTNISDLADRVKRAVLRKGYDFLDDGKPYHLNIVGVRSPSSTIDSFDDKLYLIYRDDSGRLHADDFSITTDPGGHYTQVELLNKAGAAILVPGQYRGVYGIGCHGGKYEALTQQHGKVRVWRDGNRDDKLDRNGPIHEGFFGVNIHRGNAKGTTSKVGKYSAGCQVFQKADDFNYLMGLAKKSQTIRKEHFTYTLLEEMDMK